MTAPEPTRERVEAYEAALGCSREGARCNHGTYWTDLGCPVAVAAARVEAERVACVEAERNALRAVIRRARAWARSLPKHYATANGKDILAQLPEATS